MLPLIRRSLLMIEGTLLLGEELFAGGAVTGASLLEVDVGLVFENMPSCR